MLDRFDVHMEYRSALLRDNSQSWYFQDLNDSRLNIIPSINTSVDINDPNRIISGGGTVSDNGDIVTTFEILTTSGYDDTKIIMNHNLAKAQTFMMLPTDWTNFELTFYIEFLNINANSRIEMFGRSGRHINGRPCEGTKYDLVITSDGHFRGNIKHFHSGGLEFLQDNAVLGDIEGQTIGVKFIVYNIPDDDNPTAVKVEGYIDRFSNNIWDMIYEYTDNGTKNTFLLCGDISTNIITWGGPIVGLRLINVPIGGVAIKKLSNREIDATASKIDILPEPAVIDPEAVSAPTAPPSTGYRTDLLDDQDDDIYTGLPTWGDPGDNPPPP
jgi:hypothetical protein